MKEFKNVVDLTCNLHLIPETIAVDVLKRMVDWLASGGTSEDNYIKRQLAYASQFLSK